MKSRRLLSNISKWCSISKTHWRLVYLILISDLGLSFCKCIIEVWVWVWIDCYITIQWPIITVTDCKWVIRKYIWINISHRNIHNILVHFWVSLNSNISLAYMSIWLLICLNASASLHLRLVIDWSRLCYIKWLSILQLVNLSILTYKSSMSITLVWWYLRILVVILGNLKLNIWVLRIVMVYLLIEIHQLINDCCSLIVS